MRTLDILEIATAIVPNRAAIISGNNGENTLTFEQISDRASRLATGLFDLGVQPGDRVAMVDVNVPQYCETYFACAMLDAIFVPINYRIRSSELGKIFADVMPRLVVAGNRYVEIVEEAENLGKFNFHKVVIGIANGWDHYEQDVISEKPFSGCSSSSAGDPTMILFTSGTSSRPKGVVLSHSSFCSYVTSNIPPADPDPRFMEKTILAVPLYHVAGIQSLIAGIFGGRTQILQEQFEPKSWLWLVQSLGVNRAMLVPTMLQGLINLDIFDNFDLSSLRVVTYGASAMPVDLLEKVMAKLPSAQFINAFGQTETAATITMLSPEDHVLQGGAKEVALKRRRLKSIGKPLPDIEIRIVDEYGSDVEIGIVGEILAKGQRLMNGYWKRPDETSEILSDGWLHTGDLGWRDDDGYIYLSGRSREFIKRGGEIISPQEVEDAIGLHPSVVEVAVVGVVDAIWGEVVHAAVVVSPDANKNGDELVQFCRNKIASFKKPKVVHFLDELPRNQMGKILRQELREMFDISSKEI